MKKLILAVAMLLATNITAMADDANSNETNMVEAYDINVNINSLAKYLELSDDQIDIVDGIQKGFADGLRCAATMEDDESRKNMVSNSIEYDLQNMRYVLTKEQFRKYIKVLNKYSSKKIDKIKNLTLANNIRY